MDNPLTDRSFTDDCCESPKIEQCNYLVNCHSPGDHLMARAWAILMKTIGGQILRVNVLLVVNAILAAAIVGIGAYGQRYRHHPLTRFIFLGATTLFLPIISYVVSTSTSFNSYVTSYDYDRYIQQLAHTGLAGRCHIDAVHLVLVITSAFLVQLAAINTSVIVAADDREGNRNIGPPFELLVQGVWTLYLGISTTKEDDINSGDMPTLLLQCAPFALVSAKMLFKYYAFTKAQRSFALGRSPRLISGYMHQLQQKESSQHGEPPLAPCPPPPLLVMGEDGRKVEKKPHGYVFKDDDSRTFLVTVDRIWQLDNSMLPMSSSTTEPKDLCLSFALFKLLRCRFARYEASNIGSVATLNFFWSLLLEDGGHPRVFRVIADELSFVHDYYYTSLPISYSKSWLPVLSVFISFLSIGYSILVVLWHTLKAKDVFYEYQIQCNIWCVSSYMVGNAPEPHEFGSTNIDLMVVCLLLLFILMSEVRDISSYVCSNWTKVDSICHYVRCPSSHSRMRRWVGLLLHYCKCNLMKHWDEKISQSSVLVLHQRTTLSALLRRLLHLPSQNTKVKLSAAVKVCIIDALRRCNSNGRQLSNGTSSLRLTQAGERLLRACGFNSKGTSDTILAWQIATFILEMRYPPRRCESDEGEDSPTPSISDCRIAATHLSRYCVYLVTSYPELLPDDDAWSKSLYKAVEKDATRVLVDHPDNLAALGEESNHEVLKNGAKLGEQLVIEGEETAWKLLAGFWSEMILYIAPSNNLKGHSKAIARGGELITLLWALLFHAGIVVRPGEASGTAGVV